MADDVGSSHVRTDFGELSDAELVRATRDGSRRAYAALYARHSLSALKYAKTLTSSDAEDVVSEAFLKAYAAIKAGCRSTSASDPISIAGARRPFRCWVRIRGRGSRAVTAFGSNIT